MPIRRPNRAPGVPSLLRASQAGQVPGPVSVPREAAESGACFSPSFRARPPNRALLLSFLFRARPPGISHRLHAAAGHLNPGTAGLSLSPGPRLQLGPGKQVFHENGKQNADKHAVGKDHVHESVDRRETGIGDGHDGNTGQNRQRQAKNAYVVKADSFNIFQSRTEQLQIGDKQDRIPDADRQRGEKAGQMGHKTKQHKQNRPDDKRRPLINARRLQNPIDEVYGP